MIYLVIKESGDYSDYTKENIFASKTREGAEAKIIQLEAERKPILDASREFHLALEEFRKENPWQSYFSRDKQAYEEYRKIQDIFYKDKTAEVLIKYNLSEMEFRQQYSVEGQYLIEEIESDFLNE